MQTEAKPAEPPDDEPAVAESNLIDAAGLASTVGEPVIDGAVVGQTQVQPQAMHRMYLPTSNGVLLIGLDLRIAGVPIQDAFDRQIQRLIDLIDNDGDPALPRWNDFLAVCRDNPELLGRTSRVDQQSFSTLTGRHDVNKNEMAEREEIVKLLFRESSAARAFQLLGSDFFRGGRYKQSLLFDAMDGDDSGTLSSTEIASAADVILRLDTNSDQRLDDAELDATVLGARSIQDDAWSRRHTTRNGYTAMDLDGYIDWSTLFYALQAKSGRRPFGIARDLLSAIDTDGNGSLSEEEARGLSTIPPDMTLQVGFPGDGSEDQPDQQASLSVVHACDEIAELISLAPNGRRLLVNEGQFRLSISVHDTPHEESAQPVWRFQVRGRGMHVQDALFEYLDSDASRFLSHRECLAASDRLAMIKPNGITLADIPDGFDVRLIRSDFGSDDQIFGTKIFNPPGDVDAPSWFRAQDVNQDGEVSRLEFLGSGDQFDMIDEDGDGYVEFDEADVPKQAS